MSTFLLEPVNQTDQPRRGHWIVWFTVMWTAILWQPFHNGITKWPEPEPVAGALLTLAFAVTFATVVIRAGSFRRRNLRQPPLRRELPKLALMVLMAIGMCMLLGPDGLNSVVYVGVYCVLVLPLPWAVGAIVAMTAAMVGTRVWPGWPLQDGLIFSLLAASVATYALMLSRTRAAQLAVSREENMRLAVVDERTRMARDMHDILGHSLTVIRAKAELAERLLDIDVERARTELKDLESLSREALSDVRKAVEGYRELSLPGEIARARLALQAAQIEPDLPQSTEHVQPELRMLFAWAVREAVTNVIRHSAATRCRIELDADRLEVTDNGKGIPPDRLPGNGLNGLRERAGDAGATVITRDADPGFSLIVVKQAVAEGA